MQNFKPTLIILLTLLVFWGCDDSGEKEAKNLALIEKYISAVENLDYETMASCLDDNYLGLGPSHNDSTTKQDALINWKHNVDNLYESIKYLKSRNIAVTTTTGDNPGDWVSNWAELQIKYQDGESVVALVNSTYLIENDKIVKSFTFYNEADVLEQLGYVFINLGN